MIIKRTIEPYIRKIAGQFPVVAIIGPRQSGKTFLAKHLFPEKAYVNAEYPDTRQFIEEDPRGFLEQYRDGAIIDEVQRVPDLFSYLQGSVDDDPRAGRFILTGSQHFLLHAHISQSLAGRVGLATLLPLSVAETFDAGISSSSLESEIIIGWYPRVRLGSVEGSEWYENYRATYVEKDVRSITRITDLGTFQTFLKLCAARTGQLLNLSSIGIEAGIAHNTVRAWIDILTQSFLVHTMAPYYRNFNKRLVKTPKLHFLDTGLVCSLLGIRTVEQLLQHPLRGPIFESFIITEIVKARFNGGLRDPLYFWRDKSGHEVDCLIERGIQMMAVEIKAGRTITQEMFGDLTYFSEISKQSARESFLVYGGEESSQRKNGAAVSWKDVATIPLA